MQTGSKSYAIFLLIKTVSCKHGAFATHHQTLPVLAKVVVFLTTSSSMSKSGEPSYGR